MSFRQPRIGWREPMEFTQAAGKVARLLLKVGDLAALGYIAYLIVIATGQPVWLVVGAVTWLWSSLRK